MCTRKFSQPVFNSMFYQIKQPGILCIGIVPINIDNHVNNRYHVNEKVAISPSECKTLPLKRFNKVITLAEHSEQLENQTSFPHWDLQNLESSGTDPDSTHTSRRLLFDVCIYICKDIFFRVFAHLQYVYRTFPFRCQIDVY